jgi:hypothetical protein
VVNVNDLPEILSVSPENGSVYRFGETVSFSVEVQDEEGDELTVTWIDGDNIIGTGSTLEYGDLEPGRHTITVSVTDGEGAVEEVLMVTIEEEEQPWSLLVAIIVIVAVVLAALVFYRRRG